MSNKEQPIKTDDFLSFLERIICIIRPKYHNVISRVVIGAGLLLVVESQVNLIEALGVALFEKLFGPSEYLRHLFAGSSYPWIGVILVVCGLVYHAVVTVGLELVEKYRKALPPKPQLNFSFLNSDEEKLPNSKIKFRGKTCVIPDNLEIPDNTNYSKYASKQIEKDKEDERGQPGGISSVVSSITNPKPQYRINKDFYRKRAKFLQVWGGAENFTLALFNAGAILCRNIEVEIRIPKEVGVSVDNRNDLSPLPPSQESVTPPFDKFSNNIYQAPQEYDVKTSDSTTMHIFTWKVGNLQAKANRTSDTKLFFRIEVKIQIEVSIFCDELADPIQKTIQIIPAEEKIELNLEIITQERKEFSAFVNDVVMDGYLKRYSEKFIEEMNNRTEHLLP